MSSSAQQLTRDQRLLWEPLIAWNQMPEDVREHALNVLTAMYIEFIKEHKTEIEYHDQLNNH